MSSFPNIFFPTVRRSYPGVGNPAYVDDIKAANQMLIDGLAAMLGLYNSEGFQIISGLEYDAGNNVYAPGIFFLNGFFYYMPNTFAEGLYLQGTFVDVMAKNFSDQNPRFIYTNYVAVATSGQSADTTPLFSGPMAQYRVGLAENKAITYAMQQTIGNLKGAAFLDVGTGPSTVAAGNDPRLVGNAAYFDGKYAQHTQVIEKGTATAYIPAAANDPVNKAYADSVSGRFLAGGTQHLGDADTVGGTGHIIQLGIVVPNAAYRIEFTTGSLSANHNQDIFSNVCWYDKQPGSFGVWYRETQSGVQNVQLDWSIWGL